MILHRIERNDVEALASIERVCFLDGWSEAQWLSTLNRPDFHGWKIEDSGKTIGFIAITALFEEAELLKIAVLPDFRKRGYGKRLLSHAFEQLNSLGVERMFLEVRVTNVAATSLYLRSGFTQTRLRQKYYADGEDAVEMVKTLTK